MIESRLLGHLARRFAYSEENLATESLVWLMQSPPARAAISGFMQVAGCNLPERLTYVGQVTVEDTGRPDIIARDSEGSERVLIEGKFAAALTEKQPEAYLQRLPFDQDGILLVVAPNARISTLWVELLRALPEFVGDVPAPSEVTSTEILHVKVTEHRTLALTSWRRLVTHVVEALRAADQRDLATDAEQLLGLTEAMDAEAFAPLRPQDLNQNTGRQVAQLSRLIDGVRTQLVADPTSLVEAQGPRSSHGRIFYGWYLQSRRTKVQLWFGFLPWAWAKNGISPLWLQTTKLWPRERWLQALGGLRESGQVGLFDEGDDGLLVPVILPKFAGEFETIDNITQQIADIFARLDAVVPAGEPPAPDVDIAMLENPISDDE